MSADTALLGAKQGNYKLQDKPESLESFKIPVCFKRTGLSWNNLISQILSQCNGLFLQLWFCSVRTWSPCITEAKHWGHPSDRDETELLWNFEVSTFSICKVILKFSSVTKQLQCTCWRQTTYHQFVDIFDRTSAPAWGTWTTCSTPAGAQRLWHLIHISIPHTQDSPTRVVRS